MSQQSPGNAPGCTPLVNRPAETAGTVEEVYRDRAVQHAREQRRYQDRSRIVSYTRVFTFVAGAACLIGAATSGHVAAVWLSAAGGALVLVFLALVAYHAGIDREERRHAALREINEIAVARLNRDWTAVPTPAATAPASHPYADDLDLFGHASLFALTWTGGTAMGRDRLAAWLLQPASPDRVRARQNAVAELAPLLDLRQDMLAAAKAGGLDVHDVDRFIEWAEGPAWLSANPLAAWSIRALTAAILVLIGLHASGAVHAAYWLLPVMVAFIVSNLFAVKVEHVFNRAFAHYAVFGYYGELFRLMASMPARSPILDDLRAAIIADRLGADRQMKRLDRLMHLADLRHSALIHLPVQVLTLWDFHLLLLVERWQRRTGPAVRKWFDALATFEALAALAALRFDNPGWTSPDLDDRTDLLDATGLGHPLLPGATRVGNDVRVGPPRSFLLVTGSNMSGKSTLLRAIGVNAVLAQAGAPVCATSLRMPPVRLYTSMRVQDSLEEGVSFFMAAVKRLKQVVQAADSNAGSPLLLYLLDEVLQGTNTAERQIAVRSILRHLLARPAIGAVTTHDLALAETADLSAAASAVHFTEHLGEPGAPVPMTFDYRLRPGVATSRNALKLMQMVGLSVGEDK